MSTSDLVTVLIPAFNEEGTISECLDSVVNQTYQRLQVIVVDGASTDRTAHVVAGFQRRDSRVECLANPERTIPKSLNLGLGAANGRWLVRVDAHSTVPPNYVEKALSHLSTGTWGGVGGRKDAVGITPAGKAIATVLGSALGVGGSIYHHGTSRTTVDHIPFGAYPTALVRELGGWNEAILANEDFEFDHRLRETGHRLLFDPDLRIRWRCRQSLPGLFKQYLRYGRGKAFVAALHPESLSVRHLIPPVFVSSLGLAALARNQKMIAAISLPYLLFVSVATVRLAPKLNDLRAKACLPFVFPAMHIAWGVGFWVGAARLVRNEISVPNGFGGMAAPVEAAK